MKPFIEFKVTNQTIKRVDRFHVVARSVNYLRARFTFSSDWEGTVKTALFTGDVNKQMILDDNNECDVPWEWLEHAGTKHVSVFGGDRITVDSAEVMVHESGYTETSAPEPPTPNLYDQLIAYFGEKYADVVRLEEWCRTYANACGNIRAEVEAIQRDVYNAVEHIGEDVQTAKEMAEKSSQNASQTSQDAQKTAQDREAVESAKADIDTAKTEVETASRTAKEEADKAVDASNRSHEIQTDVTSKANTIMSQYEDIVTRSNAVETAHSETLEKAKEVAETKIDFDEFRGGVKAFPQTAQVGQIFAVKAVNADGTLVLEAVDKPSGDGRVKDVQIAGTTILGEDGVADIPKASNTALGLVRIDGGFGITQRADGTLTNSRANNAEIDGKTNYYKPIVPSNLEYAVTSVVDFESGESSEVTFVEESDLEPYVKNTDYASGSKGGIVKTDGALGIVTLSDGRICLASNLSWIDNRSDSRPVLTNMIDYAVKKAMCDGKGDAWTNAEQLSARKRIGIGNPFVLITSVTLTEEVSKFQFQLPYICEKVFVETITPQASVNGQYSYRFSYNSIQYGAYIANGAYNGGVSHIGVLAENINGLLRITMKGQSNSNDGTRQAYTRMTQIGTDLGCTYVEVQETSPSAPLMVGTTINIYGIRA